MLLTQGSGPYSTLIGGSIYGNPFGRALWVDSTDGSGGNGGSGAGDAFTTIQAAVDASLNNDTIFVAPGQYDETVTIGRTNGDGTARHKLTIIGLGGRGAAYIEPSTEDAGGLVCHADDVTIVNLGIAAEDETSAVALTVTGARFRAIECKIEGGAKQLVIGPGTVAQEAAGTHGRGSDALFEDCEFCWGTDGIHLTCTDYGGVTQARFKNCRFHNLTGKHLTETVGSGGAAAVTFFNLTVIECDFDDLEDGTAPTNYIDLNGDNANSGVVAKCVFPTAINSGLNLVSTAVHWVSNFHTGGISTGQPS